jgi:starvation-inducible DNA-binding protein
MKQTLVDHLNRELATAQILLLNTKRYHWMVASPHFRDYHLRFEELYQAVEPMVDELGERIRMLEGVPVHTPAQISAASAVAPSDPDVCLDAQAMLAEALDSEERVIDLMHSGIEKADKAGDPGTADLLTRFVQAHQKQAWFLRSAREQQPAVQGLV